MFGEAVIEVDPEHSSNKYMMLKTRACLRAWRNSTFRVAHDGTTHYGCVSLAEPNTLGLDPKAPTSEVIEKVKGTTQEPDWHVMAA
ncbi:hypothetical protein A0H81_05615 [Grifola frondosa]|uniref:Uncharacterized protein n=1 Tax=Grifola frondosa TaxID=5627 RepID=A0A1C7MHY6_GRIFR|nr:hypothetical protein A0H81_05615 [Grifola frondosa]